MTETKDLRYNSGDGFQTAAWGPPLWHFLHTIGFNYPVRPTEAQKRQYARFVKALGNVLPCVHCRNNYQNNLRSVGFGYDVFESRRTFGEFVYRLHQEVNRMLNKSYDQCFNDVRNLYECFRSKCSGNTAPPPGQLENGCVVPLRGRKVRCHLMFKPRSDTTSNETRPSLWVDPAIRQANRAPTPTARARAARRWLARGRLA